MWISVGVCDQSVALKDRICLPQPQEGCLKIKQPVSMGFSQNSQSSNNIQAMPNCLSTPVPILQQYTVGVHHEGERNDCPLGPDQ